MAGKVDVGEVGEGPYVNTSLPSQNRLGCRRKIYSTLIHKMDWAQGGPMGQEYLGKG